MLRRKPLRSRGRACKAATRGELEERRLMVESGCVIGWLRLGKRIAGEVHHVTLDGKHGQLTLGEGVTVCINRWSHRGYALDEFGWSKADCRRMLGPSFAEEPSAFREMIGGFDALRDLQKQLIAPRLELPSWMR